MKLGYCGCDCSRCPVYVATKTGDLHLKERVAERWHTAGYPISAEDIQCHGCQNGTDKFKFCYECQIRSCNMHKDFTNCSDCENYPCVHLDQTFKKNPDTKERLDQLHKEKYPAK